MWSEFGQLLLALLIWMCLGFLVPRRAARTWALWLLTCLALVCLEAAGEVLVGLFFPDWQADTNSSKPPGGFVGAALLLGSTILLLLLRAEPTMPTPEVSLLRFDEVVGFSVLLFGLTFLVVTLVEATHSRSVGFNLVGVVVIAAGYYLRRGSRRAAGWAAALMALFALFSLLFAIAVLKGENVSFVDTRIPPKAPWAFALGLALAGWAAVNVLLTLRILLRI
jgi:hypothetical protein